MKHYLYVLALMILATSCNETKKDSTATEKSIKTQSEIGPFNPSAGSLITDDEAKKWAKAYDDKNPEALRGYYFGADVYKKALETPGATGLRIWQGINDKGEQVMMLVPTDKNGETIFGGTIYEFGQGCPPYCDTL